MAEKKAEQPTAYTKADLARDLHEIAITLENEGEFYREFTAAAPKSRPSDQRREIRQAALRYCPAAAQRALSDRTSPGAYIWETLDNSGMFLNREHIRRYLVDIWKCPAGKEDLAPDVRNPPPFEFWLDSVKFPDSRTAADPAPVPQPTPKEPTMNPQSIIEITTKTLVNGLDVASLSDSAIYDLISAQEAEIKKLQAIENKPKRLINEIEKRQAGIAALVAHLDSKAD